MKDNAIQTYLKRCQSRVNKTLRKLLPSIHTNPKNLHKAMRYSLLSGGKRLRPALVYAVGESLKANPKILDQVSAAVEMIHVFSLIHDDLPSIDNHDLRRGKPSCHIAFDEATAILAGDALHNLAYQTIADLNNSSLLPKVKIKMLQSLTRAVGSAGLIGGETLDIEFENKKVSLKELTRSYELKTGALITASILLGAYSANCIDKRILDNLTQFGYCLGLAFQIHDDIIGIESNTETLGKPQNSDSKRHKPTFPSLLDMQGAKKKEALYFHKAMYYLHRCGIDSKKLEKIAIFVIERKS